MTETRVAIYSGEIPAPVFIERLIEAISAKGFSVLLFGTIVRSVQYEANNVLVIPNYSGIIGNIFTLIKVIKLRLLFPHRYFLLRSCINAGPFDNKSGFRKWKKFVPVVLNLPDIFHVQWAKSASEWLFLKKFGVKLVLSLRGSHINYSPAVDSHLAEEYRQVFPQYDAFHAVSQAILDEAEKYGVERKRSYVIYSGLPLGGIKLKLPNHNVSKTLEIISVGRFHWVKGYDYLLDALSILKQKALVFHQTIVAPDVLLEELLYQISDLGLNEYVSILPYLPQSKLYELYKDCDLMVLPSVKEGIANVVLEAMSVGLPVLSTDCGGIHEVIEHDKNGFLVPFRSPVLMAEEIQKISRLPIEVLADVKANALGTIREKFDLDQNILKFQSLYNCLRQ